MRQLLIIFLAFSFFFSPAGVWAQSDGSSVYEVTDVAADVTANNSAHARDQAIAEAQRSALEQLLDRLGVDKSVADNLHNDDIAALVQNFEVQNERVSSVRYLGTFTVQFKPNAVRNLLGTHNSNYTEVQSKPVVIIAISNITDHPILWEESTKWRSAWENSPHKSGLVPIIVPAGDLDDIAVLGTTDAVNGKIDSIKALIDKYQADGAVVTTLNGDPDKTTGDIKIDILRYASDGTASQPTHVSLPAPVDKTASDRFYIEATKLVRAQLEKSWRDEAKTSAPQPTATSTAPVLHLLVDVPITTLAEWAQIKRKLGSVPLINRINVITLARGSTSIEIEFHDGLEELQAALLPQNLSLTQSGVGGAWILQETTSGNPL